MHALKAIGIWTFQFLAQLVGIILGLIVIPLALQFPDDSKKDETLVIGLGENGATETWWLRTLPKWAKWWNNPIDGTLGDDDLRWAGRDIPFGWKNTYFMGQFWWMAIRNPFNYTKRFILSCDVRKNSIEKIAGQDYVRDDLASTGWQFLKCGHFYTFYGVWQWGKSERAFVVQIGNKFDLEDNFKTYLEEQEYKYFKGYTFEINPYKHVGEE